MLNLISEEQNGFRKLRSCNDHIFVLTSIIRNRIFNNKSTYAAFIDMEKAFDKIDRNLLFYKLLQYNIDGNMYYSIKQLYQNNVSCIRLNHYVKTEWFKICNGLRQGDPQLFSIYINGLVEELNLLHMGVKIGEKYITCLLFADDIVIISEAADQLQLLLYTLENWCNLWKLNVNLSKSKIIHFCKPRLKQTEAKFLYKGLEIEKVKNYKYLGIYLNENMDFSFNESCLLDSASRALGAIIGKFKSLKNIGFKTFTKSYDQSATPIVDYASDVLGFGSFNSIDNLQNRTLRYFLGVHRYAPILGLQGDSGWVPPRVRRHLCMIRLWNKLVKMNDNRLTKFVFSLGSGPKCVI